MQSLINTRESLIIYVIIALLAIIGLTQLVPIIATPISEVIQRPATMRIKPSL